MKFRPACAALAMTLAVAACGELPFGQGEPETPSHSGPPTVSPLDQPIQTSDDGTAVSTAEARTMNTALFRATGDGGAWAVTTGNDMAVLERSGQRSVGVPVRRITYARGVEFVGQMSGRAFTVNITAQECTDGSGKQPFSARVSVAGQRLTGCATPTETMPVAQTRAPTGVPAATRRATPAAAPASTPEAQAATPAEDTTPAADTQVQSPAVPSTQEDATPEAQDNTRMPASQTAPSAPPASGDGAAQVPADGISEQAEEASPAAAEAPASTPAATTATETGETADTAPDTAAGAATQSPAVPPLPDDGGDGDDE